MKPEVDAAAQSWPKGVLSVRAGPGANCSSIGSAIHLLFASGVLAGMAAVVVSVLADSSKPVDSERKTEPVQPPVAQGSDDD